MCVCVCVCVCVCEVCAVSDEETLNPFETKAKAVVTSNFRPHRGTCVCVSVCVCVCVCV